MDETFSVKANYHFVWISYLKSLQWLFESEMQKVIFSPQNKGSQHLCAWLHSCGTLFYFLQTFSSAFCTQPTLFKLNPVCIISGLQEHDPAPSIFLSLWWTIEQDFHRLNGRVKILTQPVLGLDTVIRSVQDAQSWDKAK